MSGASWRRWNASGKRDDTIIIFTSDHGEWLGEHLRYGKGYPAHDAASRVPLIIDAPGMSSGQTRADIVESVDILPTLLEAGWNPNTAIPAGTESRADFGWRRDCKICRAHRRQRLEEPANRRLPLSGAQRWPRKPVGPARRPWRVSRCGGRRRLRRCAGRLPTCADNAAAGHGATAAARMDLLIAVYMNG